MKATLTFIASTIGAAAILWLSCGFAMLGLDPAEWAPALRLFAAAAWAITVVYLFVELKPLTATVPGPSN